MKQLIFLLCISLSVLKAQDKCPKLINGINPFLGQSYEYVYSVFKLMKNEYKQDILFLNNTDTSMKIIYNKKGVPLAYNFLFNKHDKAAYCISFVFIDSTIKSTINDLIVEMNVYYEKLDNNLWTTGDVDYILSKSEINSEVFSIDIINRNRRINTSLDLKNIHNDLYTSIIVTQAAKDFVDKYAEDINKKKP